MGVHKLPYVEDYGTLHPLLVAPGIIQGMSIWRLMLQSCLHFNDNSNAKKRGEPGYDKLHKIRAMLESIRANCHRYYRLHREVTIDEAMMIQGSLINEAVLPNEHSESTLRAGVPFYNDVVPMHAY